MSIWNKVLLGLIAIASLALFYMAARTMKTHQYWRELARACELKLATVRQDNQRLEEGIPNPSNLVEMGRRRLRTELNNMLVDRRRAWFQCDPKPSPREEDGAVHFLVTIEQPLPHGIADGTVLHAFESASVEDGGRYLGEFKVVKAEEKSLVLASTSRPTASELKQFADAKRPWDLYETLPADNHKVFASLSDDDKKAMLRVFPPEKSQAFLKDGTPATKDDPPELVEDGKYVRPLTDYTVAFRAARTAHTLLTDQLAALTLDAKLVSDALALANKQEEALKKGVTLAEEQRTTMQRERDIVAQYHGTLQKELDAATAAITELIQSNLAKAGRIAKAQLEATRRIDERTRAMAQSGTGG